MRNWCVAAALSVLVASPLCAQQKAASPDDTSGRTETAAEKSSGGASSAAASDALVPSKGIFALPAVPRPKPFPKPRPGGSKDSDAPGQLVPRYEFGVLYDYVNFSPGGSFSNFNNHGATGAFTYNASRWLGLTAELGGYRFKNRDLNGTPVSGSIVSYLFGPRLNWRKFDYFVPFAEFLLGGSHGGAAIVGVGSQSSFSVATGGGVDMILSKNFAWRVAQLDYYMTNFSGIGVGGNARQDSFRAGTGLVYRWGISNPPPPPTPNRPPVAACSVNPTSIYAGSGDTVAVHVNASDPDNDPLTYSYSATGGAVEGTGPDARWNSTGAGAGSYTVNVKVDDGKGGTASCSADIKVEEKPNHPPTASVSVEHNSILPGERTAIACNGSDPDNDPLTYSYTATGGQVTGTGANVQFDSTGLQPGTYTVKCAVNDGHGGTADASGNVEVKEPPQVKQLEAQLALHSVYFPTAQPTEAKPTGGLLASQAGTLDSLAADYQQYLKYRPAAHLILEGHADSRGAKEYNLKLSERRVGRARSYLVEKGVAADHIEVKAFGFEKNMTSDEVKKLLDADSSLAPAEKQKLIKNIDTVRMANNRRVDVTLSTTGEQSVRQFPFNAKDALTLLSRGGAAQGKAKAAAAKSAGPKAAAPKAAAPKKPATP
ncbi:MAG: flagellar motor protein MotB [Acidobacteria bacterium]|nr:MAG: flagellar motor protein MotB [Acidobacteriota bacterium]